MNFSMEKKISLGLGLLGAIIVLLIVYFFVFAPQKAVVPSTGLGKGATKLDSEKVSFKTTQEGQIKNYLFEFAEDKYIVIFSAQNGDEPKLTDGTAATVTKLTAKSYLIDPSGKSLKFSAPLESMAFVWERNSFLSLTDKKRAELILALEGIDPADAKKISEVQGAFFK